MLSEKLLLFIDSWQLWGGAVAAAAVTGAVCGFIGIYVILHRMVFLSAAMSQVSSLGVMIAFWLAQQRAEAGHAHTDDLWPLLFAGLFTSAFSAAIARGASARIGDRSKSSESLIGSVYLVSTAGLLLVGDRVTQGAHDVANILFGNAVAVDTPHLLMLAAICGPILLLHAWLRKDLVFISYDPSMATTLGYPVVALRIFLLVSLGMVISLGTRTIGALPVFSFSVLPPIACLALFQDLRWSFWASAGVGALSAFLGYLGSFVFSFPTGACMTVAAAGFLVIGRGLRWAKSIRESRSRRA
jgi:zinc transport system permease protein